VAEKVIFHVDMDAFYASVEQADNPAYRGKPVIIGADPGKRGVVAACSYEARKFGVHSAMPIRTAFKKCPKGIYLPVRMARYQELSVQIMKIFEDFTPSILQISIDEAFLDMTGTEGLFGAPEVTAERIKRVIRESTGLAVSIGIAPNRFLAKLASDYKKPDGLYRILPGQELEFISSLKLKNLWGVGEKTLERLMELNILSIPQLQRYPESTLKTLLGNATGSYLYKTCRGMDPGIYQEAKSHSISNETTFEEDTAQEELLRNTLLSLAHQVMFRLMREEKRGKTVFVKLRYSDFTTTTIQHSLEHPVTTAEELFSQGWKLFIKRWNGYTPLRLLGLGISSLEDCTDPVQRELFESAFDKKKKVEETVLRIKNKIETPLVKASLLEKKNHGRLSGHIPKTPLTGK